MFINSVKPLLKFSSICFFNHMIKKVRFENHFLTYTLPIFLLLCHFNVSIARIIIFAFIFLLFLINVLNIPCSKSLDKLCQALFFLMQKKTKQMGFFAMFLTLPNLTFMTVGVCIFKLPCITTLSITYFLQTFTAKFCYFYFCKLVHTREGRI